MSIETEQKPATEVQAMEHGLSKEEWQRVTDAMGSIGRTPNLIELGIFAAMWSEHCSYKSSRRFLKQFPTTGPRVLQGPGENAGVVDVGDGLAVAFKMESHNHPSYIEPYQGAATGVGGILRDVFTMGARPIASMNSLRFGSPTHPRTARLLNGVVAGIAGYGNCIGVPTVGGEVQFDESYDGNCLVNAFTLGILKSDKIFRGTASGVGNPVIYIGARTGRDGLGGAVMSSAEFDEESESKRPTVQVGDPFLEKLLLEACLELFRTDALVGIQDMGAAGLTSSSVEMASRAGSGLVLNLDLIPMRETHMTPYELMLSESQERMLLVAKKGREKEVLDICEKWDLSHAIVGEVTNSEKLVLRWEGKTVAELPIAPLTDGAPQYERPLARPTWQDEIQKLDLSTIASPTTSAELTAALKTILAAPNVASKKWIYTQYDHTVRLGGALRPGDGDAAVVRFTGQREGGVALAVDCNSRWVYLEPALGAAHAVVEGARNVSCVGGEPIAITDCLNFGNPTKPEIMWQFSEACRGISEACRALGTPVVSGNVSLYNETEGRAIFPTPTIGTVGLIEDCRVRAGQSFLAAGEKIALLGELAARHLGGSEYLRAIHGQKRGMPPPLDYAKEKSVQGAVRAMIRAGLVRTAHDCSDGGLAVTLAECSFGNGVGCDVALATAFASDPSLRLDGMLFGEDAARIVIAYPASAAAQVAKLAADHGAVFQEIGTVGGDRVSIRGKGGNALIDASVFELREGWQTTIAAIAG